jgi:hypothetical protein
VKVMTFRHTKASDPENPFFVNVMWPLKDIKKQECYMMDFLTGFNDQKHFRSTRLHAYFDTPMKYFKDQLQLLRNLEPKVNVETTSNTLEEGAPLKSSISVPEG